MFSLDVFIVTIEPWLPGQVWMIPQKQPRSHWGVSNRFLAQVSWNSTRIKSLFDKSSRFKFIKRWSSKFISAHLGDYSNKLVLGLKEVFIFNFTPYILKYRRSTYGDRIHKSILNFRRKLKTCLHIVCLTSSALNHWADFHQPL